MVGIKCIDWFKLVGVYFWVRVVENRIRVFFVGRVMGRRIDVDRFFFV